MPAIEEDITGTTPSADYTPSEATAIVIVDSDSVLLECKAPNGAKYVPVAQRGGAFAVQTPDTGVVYRFRGLSPNTSAHVYMGP